jgi:hypothetical protein
VLCVGTLTPLYVTAAAATDTRVYPAPPRPATPVSHDTHMAVPATAAERNVPRYLRVYNSDHRKAFNLNKALRAGEGGAGAVAGGG